MTKQAQVFKEVKTKVAKNNTKKDQTMTQKNAQVQTAIAQDQSNDQSNDQSTAQSETKKRQKKNYQLTPEQFQALNLLQSERDNDNKPTLASNRAFAILAQCNKANLLDMMLKLRERGWEAEPNTYKLTFSKFMDTLQSEGLEKALDSLSNTRGGGGADPKFLPEHLNLIMGWVAEATENLTIEKITQKLQSQGVEVQPATVRLNLAKVKDAYCQNRVNKMKAKIEADHGELEWKHLNNHVHRADLNGKFVCINGDVSTTCPWEYWGNLIA